MKKHQQYRQGDVFIERIAKLPKSSKAIQPSDGLVILARGEVTGHHHSFVDGDVVEMISGNTRIFNVRGRHIQARLPILRKWREQVLVEHPEFGKIEFCVNDLTIDGNYACIDASYGLLRHQEHNTHGIPSGLYSMPMEGRGTQREYSPEEIRNVAD